MMPNGLLPGPVNNSHYELPNPLLRSVAGNVNTLINKQQRTDRNSEFTLLLGKVL